jgi:flagellar biosynthesis anti-sigma factor FlgM
MKIEGNRPNLDQAALQRLDRAASEGSKPAATPAKTGTGDRVALSADAALANDAMKAATDAPSVRPEVVQKMRALLAAGKLGTDAHSLADSLIDSMVTRK